MLGNSHSKLHNAMCRGLIGKGPASEVPIDFDSTLKLIADARANGSRLEGVDVFADPYTPIDSTKEDIQRLADKIAGYGLAAGSVVAPSGLRSATVQR